MRGTYETVDNRPALRFERRLAHPIDKVWRAVTEPDELGRWFDVLETWSRWADDVRGRALDCGHFLAEERPEEVVDELRAFLGESS